MCEDLVARDGILAAGIEIGVASLGFPSPVETVYVDSWVACNVTNPSYIVSIIKNIDKYLFN